VVRPDAAADRVVRDQRRVSGVDQVVLGLEPVRRREVRVVLLDWVTLVVPNGPAGRDPARVGVREGARVEEPRWRARGREARPGRPLGHQLVAERVRVDDPVVDRRLLTGRQIRGMDLAADRGDECRLTGLASVRQDRPRPDVALHVVHESTRGGPEQRWAMELRVVAIVDHVSRRRVDHHTGQVVAERLAGLAHLRRRNHESERVERDLRPVAVRIGQEIRLEGPIVDPLPGDVAQGVLGPDGMQIVLVRDAYLAAERIAITDRVEEVVGGGRDVEHCPCGRDPPASRIDGREQTRRLQVACLEVPALDAEHRIIDVGPEDGRAEARREGEPEPAILDRSRFDRPEREDVGQVVGLVEGPGELHEAAR
jgi:hypothetical protein